MRYARNSNPNSTIILSARQRLTKLARRARYPLRRLMAFYTTLCLIFTGIVPVALPAQPVAVPALGAPQPLDQAARQPVYDSAQQNAQSIDEWQALVAAGNPVQPPWEAAADAEIAANVAAVTNSDAYLGPNEYRDYLQSQLDLQKGTDVAQWEDALNAMTVTEREQFLAGIMSRAGQRIAGDAQTGASDYENWQRRFDAAYGQGLGEYNTALNAVEQDYAAALAALQNQAAAFQTQLAQIQSYESQVRTQIQNQITSMTSFLGSSGLFDNGSGGLNTPGLQLQGFIDDMNLALTNGTPLSTISQSIVTFLDARRNDAITTRNNWQSQVDRGGTTPQQSITASIAILPHEHPEVSAIMDFVLNGNQAALIGVVRTITGFGSEIDISISATDAHGYTDSYLAVSIDRNQYVSQIPGGEIAPGYDRRWDAFIYRAPFQCYGANRYNSDACGNGNFTPYVVPEQYIRYWIQYTATDTNANTWNGYVLDLDPVLADWRDNVLPAIQSWEAQAAALEANYTAWQAEAANLRTAAESRRDASRTAILEDRHRWMRDAQQSASSVVSAVRASTSAAGAALASTGGAGSIPQSLFASIPATSDGTPAGSLAAVNAAEIYRSSIQGTNGVSSSLAAVQALQTSVPTPAALDSSGLQTFLSATSNSLGGLQNLAYSDSLAVQAEESRQNAIDMLAKMIGQSNVDETRQEVEYNIHEDTPVLLRPEGWEDAIETRLETDEEMQKRIAAQRARDFQVEVLEDGTIIARREIKTGQ